MRVSVKMNWDWEEISGLVYYITLDGGGGAAWGGARLEDDGILQRLGGSHDDGRRGHRVTGQCDLTYNIHGGELGHGETHGGAWHNKQPFGMPIQRHCNPKATPGKRQNHADICTNLPICT